MCAVYLSRGSNEGPLLNFGPRDVVDRKCRYNITIAGNVNRLPAECNKRNNAAQLAAACRKDLRPPAMVKGDVARTGSCRVFDKRGRILRIKLLQRERHDQQIGGCVIPIFHKTAYAFLRNAEA